MTEIAPWTETADLLPRPVPFLDLGALHERVRAELDLIWDDVVSGSSFIGGAYVAAFERQWATYCGAEHAVGVANGTDALVLALRGLGVGPGDEVVVPANTFVATAEAVVLAGAVPRFVDVDPGTLLMTAAHLETALTPRTAAVVVVHLYGQMPDMDALLAVARRHGLAVVEDAAQAHGATWRGRPAGSLGDAACFSFYPGKNLGALGDGGAVVTSDAVLARRIRSTADHGRRPGTKYVHDLLGTNSRLDALQAGLLSVKLKRLDEGNAARRAAVARYEDQLAGLDVTLLRTAPGAVSAHHLAVAQVPHRDALVDRLAAAGISTGIHYPVPCHQQAPYEPYRLEPLPVCEAAAERILSLPLFPTISADQVDQVVAAVAATGLVGPSASAARVPAQRSVILQPRHGT